MSGGWQLTVLALLAALDIARGPWRPFASSGWATVLRMGLWLFPVILVVADAEVRVVSTLFIGVAGYLLLLRDAGQNSPLPVPGKYLGLAAVAGSVLIAAYARRWHSSESTTALEGLLVLLLLAGCARGSAVGWSALAAWIVFGALGAQNAGLEGPCLEHGAWFALAMIFCATSSVSGGWLRRLAPRFSRVTVVLLVILIAAGVGILADRKLTGMDGEGVFMSLAATCAAGHEAGRWLHNRLLGSTNTGTEAASLFPFAATFALAFAGLPLWGAYYLWRNMGC